ncbi:histidine phosphatase family protein [Dietzia sp. SLG310A2-38A2]|uniref:histidine phosphatase family protein n=1 Tax=Dietzia sp. SLG310A2-38A2 TaxID=1630643 RepID=UPI0015FD9A5E|nr:histidine phosphatase family protein [Dietzia sp. SLG310A2-38A2]
MTRRLILLRHGQTHYNASLRMQGQLDTELSELGVHQAHAVGRALAHRRPWTILSSDLQRARETARALASEVGLDVRTDPRLRETHLGTWQGMSHSEVDELWPDARMRWRSTPRWSPPEGESRLDVARRTRQVVDELVDASPGWNEHPAVLVAHGGAIAALTAALIELPVEQYPIFNGLGNTCWVQLSAHPRPGSSWSGHPATPEIGPTTDGAREVLWRLDQWNAGLTPPVVPS